MGFQSAASEDVSDGGEGREIVGAERFLAGEEEEVKSEVGVVSEVKGDLGELVGGETGGEE